ncbi:MAG: hypothetical protein IID33_09745 [Planctomycetes bacterium]|nr:hypothetical protein [Planctomycetota bacterium]
MDRDAGRVAAPDRTIAIWIAGSLCGDNGKITSETGWKATRRAEDALNDLCRGFRTQSFAQREPLHV